MEEVRQIDKESLIREIQRQAEAYKVSFHEMYVVAKCESGFDPKAHNPADPNSGSYGIYQYQLGTFKSFAEEMGREMDVHDPYDQIEVTAWAFSQGLQNHWTCYKMNF